MIKLIENGRKPSCHELTRKNSKLIKGSVWLDLLLPTEHELHMIQDILHINIPTQKEMKSLGLSSRLYRQAHNVYMTAFMVTDTKKQCVTYQPVTFILTPNQLITLRYIDPSPFSRFLNNLSNHDIEHDTPSSLLLGLLETIIDRLAEHLNFLGDELEEVSKKIFETTHLFRRNSPVYYKKIIKKLGLLSDFNDKVRESLMTFERLVSFLTQLFNDAEHNITTKLDILNTDINSLNDYTSFISTKISFLLDTTLGLINIDQSVIIKIFTVAAVIFLPPTLIASIYGMNFTKMPELNWQWGYPLAIVLMICSAVFSYKFFKYKKWL